MNGARTMIAYLPDTHLPLYLALVKDERTSRHAEMLGFNDQPYINEIVTHNGESWRVTATWKVHEN